MAVYERKNNRIGEARDAAGLTQQQLADYVHASVVSIFNWESGRQEPKASVLAAMSDATGKSIEFLLGPGRAKGGPDGQWRRIQAHGLPERAERHGPRQAPRSRADALRDARERLRKKSSGFFGCVVSKAAPVGGRMKDAPARPAGIVDAG